MKTTKIIQGLAVLLLGLCPLQAQQAPEDNQAPERPLPPDLQNRPANLADGVPPNPDPPRRRGPERSPEPEITLNFRNAPVETVIDYLSREAGFVIILDTELSGTVNVVSHQPINRSEAVDLLNSILNAKGYAAIQSGRTLTIVNLNDAKRRNIPVITGSDPMDIPQQDRVVTQIIPVRYGNARELTETLQPLLPETATMTASESSNALIITDTQANIRRMAEIIGALDTTISDVATIRVYPLTNANATEAAKVINELYSNAASSRGGSSDRGSDIRSFFRSRFGGGGPPGSGGRGSSGARGR